MSTITRKIMDNQKKVDWFSNLTNEKRNEILRKYGINKSIENSTLLNEDVFLIYDKHHKDIEICEGCEEKYSVNDMRMDDEDANWWCKKCINSLTL